MKTVRNLCMLLLCLGMATACDGTQKKSGDKSMVQSVMDGDLNAVVDKGKELGKLTKVVAQNIKIEEKRVKFDMSRSEFRDTGLDMEYYSKVKDAVKDFNKLLDSKPGEKVEDTAKDFMKYLSDKFEEWSK